MTIDGVERAPLLTDWDRWRRLLIERPGSIQYQRMDDTFGGYAASIDTNTRTVTFTRPAPRAPGSPPPSPQNPGQQVTIGTMTFEQPAPNRLILDGNIDKRKYRFEMTLLDHSNFTIVRTGFKWIQSLPFHRP
jgi:hypothetical protein